MNKLKLFLALGIVCLLVINASATDLRPRGKSRGGAKRGVTPRPSPMSSMQSDDSDLAGVCTSADRVKNKNCGYTMTQGCLCYNNGTCINANVNKCMDCRNNDVFSSTPGINCPKSQPYLCEPPIPGKKYTFTQQTFDSCVCSLNGTCTERKANHGIDCQNPNILAVFENKTCPAKFLQTPPSKHFIPDKCEKSSAKSVNCLKTQTPGCVCYSSNNTCEYRTDSNRCLLCFNKDVASFNQGQYCPRLSGKMFVCDDSNDDNCKGVKNSCVCTKDGTCKQMKTNHCKQCKNNAISVIEGDKCHLSQYAPLTQKSNKEQ